MTSGFAAHVRRPVLTTAFALVALGDAGCLTAAYVVQAAGGQCELAAKSTPITSVVADKSTPPALKELLSSVADVKRYAVRHGLQPTNNYTSYVDVDRPYVVWVVSASEPLRLQAKNWQFPIVGSVPYLGWFDRDDALYHARRLKRAGWDVDVRGTTAYSTLGWFNDAVLSTMIESGAQAHGELANTVLHESVHATLYINSQSAFNESLASFVADRLTVVYLVGRFGPSAPQTTAYLETEAEGDRRARRLHAAYLQLEALYASRLSAAEKLAVKARVLRAVQAELAFARPINNATLMQFRTYNTGTDALSRLLETCASDWSRFFGALRRLDATWFSQPQQEDPTPVLDRLARGGCR